MRIIGGELGGRRLSAPEGEATRPMLDRVREAMFSTLQPWLPGAVVLDLFAGSGSLGIEALSRGAKHACFVERGAPAYKCLRANLMELSLTEKSETMRSDALDRDAWGELAYDIVFFDSPYPLLDELALRHALFWAITELVTKRCAPEGVLVFHAPLHKVLTGEFAPGLVVRERAYGSNALWYVQRDE